MPSLFVHLRATYFLALFFLFFCASFAVSAASYGPQNESCTTDGIQVSTSQNFRGMLASGKTYLLRGGTHTISGDVTIPSGATIKPYNCEKVSISTSGQINLKEGSTFAGITLQGTARGLALDHVSHDVVIRNNHLRTRRAAIFIWGGAINVTVTGNEIEDTDGGGNNAGNTVAIFATANGSPRRLVFKDNYIHTCGSDCYQMQGAGDFSIVNNVFRGRAGENLVDIKQTSQSNSGTISGNIIHCNTFTGRDSDGGANSCVILHGAEPAPGAVTFSNNVLVGCPTTVAGQISVNGKIFNNKPVGNTYHIIGNVFDAQTTGCRAVDYKACNNCQLNSNTFYFGTLRFGRTDSLPGAEGLRIGKNIFYGTKTDYSDGSFASCTGNHTNNADAIPQISCSNQTSGDPRFEDPPTGNFCLESGSPAIGKGAPEVVCSGAPSDSSGTTNISFGPCALYPAGSPNFSPYGLHWDWTSQQKELLLKATCQTENTTVDVGNGRETGSGTNLAGLTYVYHQGYYNTGSGAWTPYTLNCSGTDKTKVANAWCKGSATASLPSSARWFVAYSCIWTGSKWQCGCSDSTCATSYWQVQGINR